MGRLLDTIDGELRDRLEFGPPPQWVDPMLATLTDDRFSDPGWVYERKLDGERCLAYRNGDEIRLRSRNGRDLNPTYPELMDPLTGATQVERFVVDGEVVAFDGSTTSFARLQGRMQIEDIDRARASDIAIFYYVFDVVYLEGADTSRLPLRTRKRLLKELFDYRDPLRYTPHRNEQGERLFREACRRGWEGLIAKDASAEYTGTRSRGWLKFKCVRRQELVVGGFTEPNGERVGFGALLLGFHDGDDLVFAGKVGTGFDEQTLRDLRGRMERLECDHRPFDRGDAPETNVHWVQPRLVAEIGFTEWTSSGRLRHPRFIGLRRDKDPGDVVREEPA